MVEARSERITPTRVITKSARAPPLCEGVSTRSKDLWKPLIFDLFPFCFFGDVAFFEYSLPSPFHLCIGEYVLFFHLVTTGWISDISLFMGEFKNQSNYTFTCTAQQRAAIRSPDNLDHGQTTVRSGNVLGCLLKDPAGGCGCSGDLDTLFVLLNSCSGTTKSVLRNTSMYR